MGKSAEFGWRTTATRTEVAVLLRDIAEKLDRNGKIDIEHGPVELKLKVPDDVHLEVELDVENNEFELEIELKWPVKSSSSRNQGNEASSQQSQQEGAAKTDAPPAWSSNPGEATGLT